MKFANAGKLDGKSGVCWGERGHPSDSLCTCYETYFAGDGRQNLVVFPTVPAGLFRLCKCTQDCVLG
jgi:hypothetical protein